MNAAQILQLVGEALAVLPTLIDAGINVVDRIGKIKELADSAAAGTTTPDQIKAVRDQLDADLDAFNAPI